MSLIRSAFQTIRSLVPAAAIGAVVATGQAPLGWWFLSLPALALLIGHVARGSSPRQAALRGWIGGAAYFGLSLCWIVEPFFVEPEVYGWMAPCALILMAFGMALFWLLAGWAAHLLATNTRSRALALAFTLAGVELLRGYILTGFPWALIGHIWIDTPMVQLASAIGGFGLTLLTTLVAALPVMFGPRGLALALPVAAAGWGLGLWQLSRPEPAATPVNIRIVQPNIEQSMKWDPSLVEENFHRQLTLTATPSAPPPDLVVWPETAIPWLLNHSEVLMRMISDAASGAQVALGVQRAEGPRYFNSLAVLDPDGSVQDIYDKHHLVPFGEYVPGGDIAARFGLHGFAARDGQGYSEGPGPRLITLPGGMALPLICYEAVFPQDLRGTERPDWLLQVTNDAWFGSFAGPQQHFAQARLRAIEQGLPLIRAANTGISGVIDARGRVVQSLPLGVEGIIDAGLPAALPATLYSRSGDWPVAGLLVLAIGTLGMRRFRR